MRAGYGLDHYKQLCAARQLALPTKNLGHPFVSVAGARYGDRTPRIMYVGKSLWAKHDEGHLPASATNYESSLRWSCEWLTEQSQPTTAFWSFAHDVVGAVVRQPVESALNHIAWSNLAKIAQLGAGAPDSEVEEFMRTAEVATLRAELDCLKPELVVLVSNDAVWSVATEVFGTKEEMLCCDSDGTWKREHPRGFKLYWTRHPQGASRLWREKKAAELADFFLK